MPVGGLTLLGTEKECRTEDNSGPFTLLTELTSLRALSVSKFLCTVNAPNSTIFLLTQGTKETRNTKHNLRRRRRQAAISSMQHQGKILYCQASVNNGGSACAFIHQQVMPPPYGFPLLPFPDSLCSRQLRRQSLIGALFIACKGVNRLNAAFRAGCESPCYPIAKRRQESAGLETWHSDKAWLR